MTIPTNSSVFLDTNILVRYDVVQMPEHEFVRQAITRLLVAGNTLWISGQVMREYCRTLTYPSFPQPFTMPQAVARLRLLLPFLNVANETKETAFELLTLLENVPIGGKQVHDANIVATMMTAGITQLVTLNLADFQRFTPYITVLTPDDILAP